MFRLLIRAFIWLVRAVFRSRDELLIENLDLRQQLTIYKDKRPRPTLNNPVRAFWVGLRHAWPHWKNSLIWVKPKTVTSGARALSPGTIPSSALQVRSSGYSRASFWDCSTFGSASSA